MRIYLMYVYLIALAIYAWRNWLTSTLGLILLTCVMQRKDMPSQVAGIPGMNPWNMLFVAVLLAWLVQRRGCGLSWDLPRFVQIPLMLYVAVITITVLRAAADFNAFPPGFDKSSNGVLLYVFEDLLNPLKLILPGLILYDSCRTRRQLRWAMLAVVGLSLGYALLVVKAMPLSVLVSEANFMQHRHRIDRDTGLMAIDMSMVLASGCWGTVALLKTWRQWWIRGMLLAASVAMLLGMGLCHSRGGYITFAALGLLFAILRWRWLLALLPVGVVIVFSLFPSIAVRMGAGWGESDVTGGAAHEWHTITAGRTTYLWPNALEQIAEAPILGSGRRTILRSDMHERVLEQFRHVPSHPHSAHLEMLMDAGIIGYGVTMSLFAVLLWISIKLFRRRDDPLLAGVGGLALAMVAGLLIAGLGCESFFPTQSAVGFWAASGLALRAWKNTRFPTSSFSGRPSC